ncbi:MAG TPA: futalosine hydrolase [Desulfuromonadales bacterium]|nr:futalosine hydrolase [Desulfuromonadales bacterium]
MTGASPPAGAPLLLVAAVALETTRLRRAIPFSAPAEQQPFSIASAEAFGRPLTLLHTGVGKANAAAAVAAVLAATPAALVLNFGVAGAYPGRGLDVGDLALAEAEIYGDEGALAPEGFLDLEAMGLPILRRDGQRLFNRLPVDELRLESVRPVAENVAAAAGRRCLSGPFVTVSTCSGTTAAATALARRTGGLCENMEGAAIAQVCALHRLSFIELRGISNLAEDRDLSRWDLTKAAEIAQRAVIALLTAWRPSKEE